MRSMGQNICRESLYTGKETRERRQEMEKDEKREWKMKNEKRASEGRKGLQKEITD